jgi:hypothetical protein
MDNSKYDVIVIGAGPAGLTWVDEALKTNKKVLLIDQGEFETATYSSIGVGWESNPDVQLGGVGGTANAWQGQCVLLDAIQFREIFGIKEIEEYNTYLEVSKPLARKLSVRFDHRAERLKCRAMNELQLPDNVRIKFSYMPVVQDWNRIFKSALKSESLDLLIARVDSLKSEGSFISSICLFDNREIQLSQQTQLVIATNSISTAQLLSRIGDINTNLNRPGQLLVFDHPWRTKYRYESNGNKFAKRKIFSYHLGFNCRMKTKYKFEVLVEDRAIGVFELRPEYRGSFFSKIVVRGSQKLLGYSLINPTYVDVWCQIAQSIPIEFPNSGVIEESLHKQDYEKLVKLEEISRDVLLKSGYKLINTHANHLVNQAFHTTGTVQYLDERARVKIDYPGVAINFQNLYVSGGAGLGNCSWVNPTFTIMAMASLCAQKAFRR